MHYTDYARRLAAEHAKFSFEPGSQEIGPLHNPTVLPSSPPWNMDWVVKFHDGKHFFVKERWFPSKVNSPLSANLGYRLHFSFHYGPTNPLSDPTGIPLRDPKKFPPIFRIDMDRHGPHLHFRRENHVKQSRVSGLKIEDADPFAFVRAVLDYRATGADFDTILGFKVLP